MVKLGQRTDKLPNAKERGALAEWCRQFVGMYANLMCDCIGVIHHERRIRTIERRMNDSTYLKEHSVSSEAIVEAQRAVALHRQGIEARERRIAEVTWQFPAFWRNRPDGADDFLTDEWFSCSYDPDPVVTVMVERGAECWQEVAEQWRKRKPVINSDPVPY